MTRALVATRPFATNLFYAVCMASAVFRFPQILCVRKQSIGEHSGCFLHYYYRFYLPSLRIHCSHLLSGVFPSLVTTMTYVQSSTMQATPFRRRTRGKLLTPIPDIFLFTLRSHSPSSVGCAPLTEAVRRGSSWRCSRAGRWRSALAGVNDSCKRRGRRGEVAAEAPARYR